MKSRTLVTYAAAASLLAAVSLASAAEPIQPIEKPQGLDAGQVELGKKLYFEPRLSKSGIISCNTCHNLSMGGTDNIVTSVGHGWQEGPINSPTVLNSSYNVAQFWDGRAQDLKEQAGGPIANPGEMAFSHELAIEVLSSIPEYVAEFEAVFGTGEITIDEVTTAIAEFEKTLVTPNSRFDQWLKGDADAITETELAGYELFKNSGCVACHNGPAVGANSFQKMGLVQPYETSNEAIGLAGVTGDDLDRFKFKVPTLRNVELTYPYFHDGGAETLAEAVDLMGKLQLGRAYTADETAMIVAFLETLTGEQPQIVLPILPPSTEKTIKPVPFEK